MPAISVIHPVYKVENYIRKCLDRVVGQTFWDLEIILIDDGSPDNYGDICEEYAAMRSENTTLKFLGAANTGSCVIDDFITDNIAGSYEIKVKTIDSTPECHGATFIKMDIEGSELETLKDTRETILRNKPKLAICIYHKNEDFIDIPLYIYTLVPAYKLCVRQHLEGIPETVLYAVLLGSEDYEFNSILLQVIVIRRLQTKIIR